MDPGAGATTDGEEPKPLTDAPAGRRRTLASIAIAVVLLLQLVVPFRYYLSSDPFDERFAWRMFSAVRVTRCSAAAVERSSSNAPLRPILLSGGRDRAGRPNYGVVHNAWSTLIRRNRVAVIDAFLEHRCRETEIAETSIINRCVDVSGKPLPVLRWHRRCRDQTSSSPSQADLSAVRMANRVDTP